MESFELTGDWWLPDKFEDKVPGKLSFDPATGGVLELRFEGRFFHTGFDEGVYPLILGVVSAMEYSLTNCTIIGGSRHLTRDFSAHKIVFAIDTIFEGHHFQRVDNIVFDYMSSHYTHLKEWMDQSNFRNENGGVRYLEPEPTAIRLDHATVAFRAGITHHSGRTEVTMTEHCWVEFTPNKGQHFDAYRQFMDIQLPNFLTLATGMPNYPSNVLSEVTEDDMPKSVNIYYRVPGYVENPPQTITEYMLFTFEDVRNSTCKYLPAWIAKYEQLHSVIELYFQTIYSRSLSAKTGFLLLAQALEAYHRNLYGGNYLSVNTYKKARREIKKAIPDCVEGEHRSNLEAMINNGNQFSLKTRILNICDEILPSHLVDGDIVIVDSLLTDSEGRLDKEDFLEKVKATRNYLTHHPKNRSANVISDNDLFLYVAKLRFLLRICFLVELRFPSARIKDRVIQNPEYRVLIGSS